MSLSNTLSAALSGLDVNQTKLNVVGNNIANANTVAFKSTRAVFKPQFYVTDAGGSQPNGESGGTNPSQRGLGAVVAGLERDLTQGSIEPTGRPTDLAIDGEGYFIVKSDATKYTRDGNFKLNPDHKLITSAGDFVQGYGVDSNYNVINGPLTDITIPLGGLSTAQATENAFLTGNLNTSGPVAAGASILTSQGITTSGGVMPDETTLLTDLVSTADMVTPLFDIGETFSMAAQKGTIDLPESPFTITETSTLGDLMSFFQNHLGINTDVPDDGNDATPLPGVVFETDPADETGVSGRIVITSNLGTENKLVIPRNGFTTSLGIEPLKFATGSNAEGIASNPVGESIRTNFTVYDSLGTAIDVRVAAVMESKSTTGTTWRFFVESPGSMDGNLAIGTGTLTFDSYGRLRSSTGTEISVSREGTGAVSPLNINLDFSQITALDNNESWIGMNRQDGKEFGQLTGFDIDERGKVVGKFSNGDTRTLGQIAMATFSNPNGLLDEGGNMYVEGPSSGPAVIGTPGSFGSGKIVAKSLELSNVDLSEEFVNMIIASTGFSAASRVITTSDQLISELLNTTR